MKKWSLGLIGVILLAAVPVQALNSYETCLANLMNDFRAANGQKRIPFRAEIYNVALNHSKEMANAGTIYHNRNLANELPPFVTAGENVGMGPDCQSVHDAFLGSPGHRENLLDPDWRQYGIAVVKRGDTIFVTENFIWPKASAPRGQKPDNCD